ncbi:DUF3500 domain-containing protein [Fibrella sp. HMF5036]|uniref:DUF3500 domain-containing protein n=2 Tax=Fibrella aquatilis TaxID=2817059 RepID=A0A939JZ55_9BACT|nr:DUF3500 domain-containing protein [Fibrella aquatilis]
MADAAQVFLATLNAEQRKTATYSFADNERFTWDFVPHARHGLTLKQMQPGQRKVALELLKTGLSAAGYDKALQIMDLENVLRVVENRPANDTYRDPENYYFTVFGDVGAKEPWGWRVEGHHLSVQFSTLGGRVMSITPLFMGSNPGVVRAEVPQKGKELMQSETELAFALLHTMSEAQLNQAILAKKAFGNITTGNSRRASMERMDGLLLADMNAKQRALFLEILGIYLNRYRITLAKQQMERIEKADLNKLRFAWAGDTTANNSSGYYYRIHGPMLLIEYDNSQNNANHVHTVVRDLTNDFGDDLLREHYEKQKH